MPHPATRIGRMDAADDGTFFDDGEHLIFANLHGDGIGIAVSHHPRGRAVAHHAEATAIIDNDEISAALLDELSTDAGAGAGGDNGIALGEGGAETFANFFARVGISFSSPRVRHKIKG